MKSGAILLDKKIGLTSRDEVNIVSKKLNTKKVGHIGTLDPFADGLLICLVNQATKIAPYLENLDKEYLATLKLGEATDTADKTGEVIGRKEIPILSKEKINEVFMSMLGKNLQLPPMYSAIKINGKQLYKYAREGEIIERKPREIIVYSLSLISFEKDSITFICKVSKGTYIRTLAEEIAQKLNTIGHLTSLTRTKIGEFSLNDAISSDNVSEENIIPIEKLLPSIKQINVDESTSKLVKNGMHIHLKTNAETVLLIDENGVLAIYKKDHRDIYACLRGLR